MELEQAIKEIEEHGREQQKEFYDQFPEIVQQEKAYDIMAVQQHSSDEGFAKDLEGREFNERGVDRATQNSLETQLGQLSATAGKEAAATQNITVYNDVMELWQQSETPQELITYLENYAKLRSEWNEREDLDPGREPLQEARVQYGDQQEQEYIEEILTQLVTETINEI